MRTKIYHRRDIYSKILQIPLILNITYEYSITLNSDCVEVV